MVKDKAFLSEISSRAKADLDNPCHIGAPMNGDVIEMKVQVGDEVKKGQVVCVVSAMKMEMAVQAMQDGKVTAIQVQKGDKVEGDDLLVEVA